MIIQDSRTLVAKRHAVLKGPGALLTLSTCRDDLDSLDINPGCGVNHCNQILKATLRMQLRQRPAWHDSFVSLVALAPGDGSPVFYSLSGGFAHASDLFS